MASKTTKLVRIREHKVSTAGRKRKNAVRKAGTTAANLPLNKPNAHERSLKKPAAKAEKGDE